MVYKDLLLGTHCCHDLRNVSQLSLGKGIWTKSCCRPTNGQATVILPHEEMSQEHLEKVIVLIILIDI